MTTLTEQEIRRVAQLAKLNLEPESIPQYQKNLSNILDFVEQIKSVATKGISPLAHPQDLTQPLRDDEVTAENQQELYQSLAPQTEAKLYLVPKVIDDQE